MRIVSDEELDAALDYEALIPALQQAFCEDYEVPLRSHLEVENPAAGVDSTLLLMPAWQTGHRMGVKVVTVSPENGKLGLPAVQGVYTLFDAERGNPILIMDARKLTAKRTAATSAVASFYLSNPDSSSLLMIGTGALAPELIQAHAAVRPIDTVYIWGRDFNKAEALAAKLREADISIEPVENFEDVIGEVDIISCATLSQLPIIDGDMLRGGQHLDLVGAYKPDSREVDDKAIMRSVVFVDTKENALKEGGDLVIPMKKGLIDEDYVQAELRDLTTEKHPGRTAEHEITLFKSVGHALEDLAAACLIERYLDERS
jgi:ornithine cyclodeaminase/alanine dehydrogenase-like protein (mu-crystallin family)